MTGVAGFASLLDLETVAEDTFSAETHPPSGGVQRLFGGHLIAQGLAAATRTVPDDLAAHQVRARFVKPGRPGVRLHLAVVSAAEMPDATLRRVEIRQQEQLIVSLHVRFGADLDGPDWTATPMPEVPAPSEASAGPGFAAARPTFSVFEIRSMPELRTTGRRPEGLHPAWVRTVERLPDDERLHRAVLCSISDLGTVGAVLPPTSRLAYSDFIGASLEHDLHLHRSARADEWVLIDMEPLTTSGGRGLGIGRAWTQDGTHVATWVQESLIRLTDPVRLSH